MGACEARAEPLACGVGTAAAWSLPLDDTARQRLFGRVGRRTGRAERKWRRGGGRVQRRSERAGCADSRQGAHRQALPAYRGMRCRRHPAGADTWARRGHDMATAVDAGAGQQSRTGPEAVARRSVRTRDRWLCSAWADRARGNGRGACKRQKPRPRGRSKGRRRHVDKGSQERRRVWQAKKTNNASASRLTTIKARRAGRARGTGETEGNGSLGSRVTTSFADRKEGTRRMREETEGAGKRVKVAAQQSRAGKETLG
ncbi:hypothetical protein ERJ75_001543600 [Trypanosoma vivax]|nr:hypothetical protein ERJ75_001543600 [Trypanosoma vivax]